MGSAAAMPLDGGAAALQPSPAAVRGLRLGAAARRSCAALLAHPRGERTFARPRRGRQERAQLTTGRDEGTGGQRPAPSRLLSPAEGCPPALERRRPPEPLSTLN